MFKALMSLFKKSDPKPPQAVHKVQAPKSKPKVVPTRIGELGEHKINIQLDQLPKECRSLSDLLQGRLLKSKTPERPFTPFTFKFD